MRQRNRAVLLAHGRQEAGSRIEREFERLGALVERDLQGYPALQRKLLDEITRIEEDYKKCGEVPPPPPDWVEAVAAIANVKSGGGELVLKVLDEIKRLDRQDPRQGDGRVPPRLRGAPQASSRASCRSGARSTRTSARWTKNMAEPAGERARRSMRTWSATSRSRQATDKAEQALTVSALHPVRHLA